MGMSEREYHIKVLEQFLHDYQEWGEDLELEKTIKYAISSLKTDLKYNLLYEGEEIYTKSDMVVMLEEINLKFDEQYYVNRHQLHDDFLNRGLEQGQDIIQQKINALKGDANAKGTQETT